MPNTKMHPLDVNNWVTLKELHSLLGKGYHPRTVKRLIQHKKLIQGRHYIRTSGDSGIIKINVPWFLSYVSMINEHQ